MSSSTLHAECIKYLSPPRDYSDLMQAFVGCKGTVVFQSNRRETYYSAEDYSMGAVGVLGYTLGIGSIGIAVYHAKAKANVATHCKALYEEYRHLLCPDGKIGAVVDSDFDDVDLANPNVQ